MLKEPKLGLVEALITGSTKEELIWLSGYLAGVAAKEPGQASVPTGTKAAVAPGTKITIAYGTETGNSRKLAADFAARAKKQGIQPKLVSLEQYRPGDLAREEYFLTVISTQGDGEPPAAAKNFYDHIHSQGQSLNKLKYSVLALGDTAYPLFCKAGEEMDIQLQRMGGQRICALQKCDTDYEEAAGQWFDRVLREIGTGQHPAYGRSPVPGALPATGILPANTSGAPADTAGIPVDGYAAPGRAHKKTYTGTVLANINLNDRGSAKRTHHVEIAAEGVDYQPGDAIGIIPENPAPAVAAIIALTGIDPEQVIPLGKEELRVSEWLGKKLNIVYLPVRVVKKYGTIVQQEIPETKIGLLDLLKIYPVKDAGQFREVISILEPIVPRLYSVSSAPGAHEGEIHLTVARDAFAVNGEAKYGLCSDILSQLQPGQPLTFYVHRNARFKLPAPDKDVIMVGPGTGIAPFRAFLAERDCRGADGRNWLFFGDQHFVSDFLYQTEIRDWLSTGVLTRVNTAFSRDQAQKVYVQHRMQEQAADLFGWLESGAHLYVCGAKDPMSMDVERTLLRIIQEQGGKTGAQAKNYLDELKTAGRYIQDVY
jgi:sulfite reductase (NADPH) flavoprotein alpha-component